MKGLNTLGRAPQMRPLAACLALAIAAGASAPVNALTARHDTLPASYVEAVAGRDTAHLRGWMPSVLPDEAAIATTLAGWQQRDRSEASRQIREMREMRESRGGATLPVTNCDNAGPGSLRAVITAAGDGDTVDLSQLACSVITLSSEITISVANLDIVGPGANALAITGNDATDLLTHLGSGTLSLADLTLRDGSKYTNSGAASGGCIASLGNVELIDSVVSSCIAISTASDGTVRGGGVYAAGNISLSGTAVVGNNAVNKYSGAGTGATPDAFGGGLFAGGTITMVDSLVSGNTALSSEGDATGGGAFADGGAISKYSLVNGNSASLGGGLWSGGSTMIRFSTISGNEAAIAGGIAVSGGGGSASIQNSTVSGNTAQTKYAGVAINSATATITNSTVTRNLCATSPNCFSGGVHLGSLVPLTLRSSIVAGNTDFSGGSPMASDLTSFSAATLGGDDNLMIASFLAPPADTILALPKLTSLRNNGGPTPTHALRGNSRALNAGNNAATFTNDQRGTGFPRTRGPGTDIGAFEMNFTEYLFANDFGGD